MKYTSQLLNSSRSTAFDGEMSKNVVVMFFSGSYETVVVVVVVRIIVVVVYVPIFIAAVYVVVPQRRGYVGGRKTGGRTRIPRVAASRTNAGVVVRSLRAGHNGTPVTTRVVPFIVIVRVRHFRPEVVIVVVVVQVAHLQHHRAGVLVHVRVRARLRHPLVHGIQRWLVLTLVLSFANRRVRVPTVRVHRVKVQQVVVHHARHRHEQHLRKHTYALRIIVITEGLRGRTIIFLNYLVLVF